MQIVRNQSIGAGVVVENIFSGSAFEFPETNVIVSIGVVSSLASMFVTITAGGVLVLEESEMAISADLPLIPDEFYFNFAALRGQRLVVRARNANAGANVLRAVAMIQATR